MFHVIHNIHAKSLCQIMMPVGVANLDPKGRGWQDL